MTAAEINNDQEFTLDKYIVGCLVVNSGSHLLEDFFGPLSLGFGAPWALGVRLSQIFKTTCSTVVL